MIRPHMPPRPRPPAPVAPALLPPNTPTTRVRGVADRFVANPLPPHLPGRWLGWRQATEGEEAEHTHGGNGGGLYGQSAELAHVYAPIRLVRCVEVVPKLPQVLRAIADGDLEEVTE